MTREKLVGPVLNDETMADVIIAAAERDNPDVELIVEDQGGYIRIHTPWRFRLTRKSVEEELDRPFRLPELEPYLAAFAGRMKASDEELIFYLERED